MGNINYTNRIDNLRGRYNPDRMQLFETRAYSETLGLETDAQKYVRMAMMEVDDEYTHKTIEAGNAVKEHLKETLQNVDFRYQGSVMTNTHIRGASDIDLLVLCTKFSHSDINRVRRELENLYNHSQAELSNLRSYNNRFYSYSGNTNEDLRQLRSDIERILQNKYDKCDITNPKSVKITNQHFHRDVDVVTSCWYDSYYYVVNGEDESNRAISIYNKDTNTDKGPDYPFLSISRINDRSAATQGRLKRMIRFLKNVRSDSDKVIDLSSFEINAICYSIDTKDYFNLNYKELVYLLWNVMYHLLQDGTASQLSSVVGDEKVFTTQRKIEALKLLENEVWNIYNDNK